MLALLKATYRVTSNFFIGRNVELTKYLWSVTARNAVSYFTLRKNGKKVNFG